VNDRSENELPGSSGKKRAEAILDEAIVESFPASDPESSWSGLSEPEPIEKPIGEESD
jgi:hypothetical protein